jgi:uncharacterized integral membrane protein
MIKRILTAIVLIAALALSALFTSLNPGEITLDLGFAPVTLPVGLAFVGALAIGWLLGVLSVLMWVARISADRRRLRGRLEKTSAGGLAVRDERG